MLKSPFSIPRPSHAAHIAASNSSIPPCPSVFPVSGLGVFFLFRARGRRRYVSTKTSANTRVPTDRSSSRGSRGWANA